MNTKLKAFLIMFPVFVIGHCFILKNELKDSIIIGLFTTITFIFIASLIDKKKDKEIK
jgi:hypothetical protein